MSSIKARLENLRRCEAIQASQKLRKQLPGRTRPMCYNITDVHDLASMESSSAPVSSPKSIDLDHVTPLHESVYDPSVLPQMSKEETGVRIWLLVSQYLSRKNNRAFEELEAEEYEVNRLLEKEEATKVKDCCSRDIHRELDDMKLQILEDKWDLAKEQQARADRAVQLLGFLIKHLPHVAGELPPIVREKVRQIME